MAGSAWRIEPATRENSSRIGCIIGEWKACDTLSRVLVKCQLASSGSDATRKIKQGAVKVNGERVTDFSWRPPSAGAYLIQVGPRGFVRLIVSV